METQRSHCGYREWCSGWMGGGGVWGRERWECVSDGKERGRECVSDGEGRGGSV